MLTGLVNSFILLLFTESLVAGTFDSCLSIDTNQKSRLCSPLGLLHEQASYKQNFWDNPRNIFSYKQGVVQGISCHGIEQPSIKGS